MSSGRWLSGWVLCRVLEELPEEHPEDVCPAECQEEHAFHYVRLLSGIMHSLIIALCHWQCTLSARSRDRMHLSGHPDRAVCSRCESRRPIVRIAVHSQGTQHAQAGRIG